MPVYPQFFSRTADTMKRLIISFLAFQNFEILKWGNLTFIRDPLIFKRTL